MPDNRVISLIKKPAALVGLFFLLYLVLGLSIFNDYGLSCDEPTNRSNGALTAAYVLSGNQALFSWRDCFYGTFFESILVIPGGGQSYSLNEYFASHPELNQDPDDGTPVVYDYYDQV